MIKSVESRPLVSIVIINYNYARFLGDAISSALNQSYPAVEVIVVDDGSTDNSREIIESFGNRIESIYKQNGGQGSAINAGFLKSRGELVLFLDSDDILETDVIEQALHYWDGKATKLHYRLNVIDNAGNIIGQDPHRDLELPVGDIRSQLILHGHYVTPPASGNIYNRQFLDSVIPIPEETYRRAADSYLYILAPFYGDILALPRIGAKYRMHGANGFFKPRRFSTPKELEGVIQRQERCVALIEKTCKEKGLEWNYSPRYTPNYNFTKLLLLRLERKLDYATTFHLLGNILHAIFSDTACSLKQRISWILKMFTVAFAPLHLIWRIYPHTRPTA